ncbi:MAG: hypothetical protein ACT4OJ_09880 [Bacteroidota bacterium]
MSQQGCLAIRNESGEPISYATVFIKGTGKVFIADSSGKICLKSYEGIDSGDTVLISAVGYLDTVTTVDKTKIFKLLKSFKVLPEVVVVNGEGKKEVWGTKRNPVPIVGFGGGTLSFREILNSTARIIYPEGEFKKAEIQSVAFYDPTGKGINVPVRIRVFSIGKDSLPAGDYLTDNLIIDTKGKGWMEADLKEKGLIFPKEGLIFGIELFVDSKENYYHEKRKTGTGKKVVTIYGFSLAFEKSEKVLTMTKFPGWGNKWYITPSRKDGLGNLVCRVKVKVWR